MDSPGKLVDRLMSDIGTVADGIQDYVRRPGADFTRRRLMGAEDVIRALVCMGTGALGAELAEGWLDGPSAPSASAFCQQRAKIEPEALRRLLLLFKPDAPARAPRVRGLRLAAVDGTEVVMQRNPRDAETHNPKGNGASELGYNSVYATALLDMDGGAFLDAVVQPGPAKDEPAAFRELADRCDPALTLVGDRNFASYNNFAHCAERGVGFVIRLTDAFAGRLLGADGLPDEADEDVELLLSRSQRASLRAEPGYRLISPNMKFDYLEGRGSSYRMRLRVVRFAIGDGKFENLATSLERAGHGPDELREVYAGRWGIETAFRDLKHTVGLAKLHSATARGAAQEVYARMVLYNFCAAMAALAQGIVDARDAGKELKHARAANFAAAVRACRAVLWPRAGPADGLLERIAANVCPVRPGRSFARHRRLWSPGSYSYRC